ncbi:MAG: hypothetical protein A2046_05725 [Bacteroidetes bacterium GWA2_30_7]|nr:MAG: hypothetical protein A2046_05725 [Bacteroidetes bacterium GWA2_30_7]
MKFFKLIIAFFVLIPNLLNAQIRLTQTDCNPVIKDYLRNHPEKNLKSLKSSDTLSLPFFDDFVKTQIYPDNDLWIDNYAYINSTFGFNPPSIGIATLDAVDETGAVYSQANTTSFLGDYLTSKPLKLNIGAPDDTTIYLSFLYQSGGLGDIPEYKDSLVLEFYSPVDTLWHSVWRSPGDTVKNFRQVLIHISDSIYLQNGFQFRFKNYASITTVPNTFIRTANVDGWNLDWIYLNKSRSFADTSLNDISIIKLLKPFLSNYETVPWKHFIDNTSLINNSRFTSFFKNYNTETINVTVKQVVTNNISNTQTYFFQGGAVNALPDSIYKIYEAFHDGINPFPADNNDSAEFLLRAYLITDTVSLKAPFRWNDTVSYYQKFYNYYAYDDGSAEMGFGIDGPQASNAKVALRFTTLKTDSLRAVQMYFNHTYQDVNDVDFYLTIWNDNNGKPGNIIYQKTDCKVSQSYNKNGFYIYNFDSPMLISGTFYIGWVQPGTISLNIGYDIDRDASTYTFWNSYGNWENLSEKGAVMMRPVFGKSFPLGIDELKRTVNNKLNIYPNPASDILNINISELNNNEGNIEIFDLSGRMIQTVSEIQDKINISKLENGIYLIRIKNNTEIYSAKFIVNK